MLLHLYKIYTMNLLSFTKTKVSKVIQKFVNLKFFKKITKTTKTAKYTVFPSYAVKYRCTMQ